MNVLPEQFSDQIMIKCSICRLYATSVDGTFSEMNDDDNDEDKINDKINDNNDKQQSDN